MEFDHIDFNRMAQAWAEDEATRWLLKRVLIFAVITLLIVVLVYRW